jgi:secondary thiamine-phosphate synthase enzyme
VVYQREIRVDAGGPGLFDISDRVTAVIAGSGIRTGSCHVFVRHTSASLLIQENADPSARKDLEESFRRWAPENAPHYTHTSEGPDDMPSHLRAALTSTSETIPVTEGRAGLGTWQGLYLFEHRRHPRPRHILVTISGE